MREITSLQREYLSETGKNVARQLQKGSILICCIGSIGKCAIIDKDGTANQQINALTPILNDSDYLLYAIGSGSFNNQLNRGSRATTVSIISKSKFLIKDYQRGYRWESKQIIELLNDIMDFETTAHKEKYCMQPLVVKKIECFESNNSLNKSFILLSTNLFA